MDQPLGVVGVGAIRVSGSSRTELAGEIVRGEPVVIKEGVTGLRATEGNPLVIWLLDHAAIVWIQLAETQPFWTPRGLSRLPSLEDARRRSYSAIAFDRCWRG